MSKLREAVDELEGKVSSKFASLQNKLPKHGKKIMKKPKFEGVKRGFVKKIMRRRGGAVIVAETNGETIVEEEINVEAIDCPNTEPAPSSDVLEVWFPGCHSGEYTCVFLIIS